MAGRPTTKDGGKGGRKSEVITIRLDPRLKYLAELAARRQRRPLSSYVEWAIESSLGQVRPSYGNDSGFDQISLADAASALWDVDEADRFAKLALRYPELLTHEEQIVWKLIRECGYVWKGHFSGKNEVWQWTIEEDHLIWDRLRENWPIFGGVARGEKPISALPKWEQKKAPTFKTSEMDDEIPF
jgi:hypothetical protein